MSKPKAALQRLVAAAEQGVPASVEDARFAAEMYALAQERYGAACSANARLHSALWGLSHRYARVDAVSPYPEGSPAAHAWQRLQSERRA